MERTESAVQRAEQDETSFRPASSRGEKTPPWFPDWTGQTCIIVASGPSAADVEIYEAKDRGARCIAINNSWQLAPWADVLYGSDFRWWSLNGGVPEFKGIKITQDRVAVQAFPNIKLVEANRKTRALLFDTPGVIGWGGNSGFHAVNLAAQFGVRKIILAGFDMTLDHGVHWHGQHGKGLNNPQAGAVARWRTVLDDVAEQLRERGVSTFNVSPISSLRAYPKVTLQEALDA